MTAEESLQRLKEGNRKYASSSTMLGNISHGVRVRTANEGQHPIAICIACADARVIPNAIFSCGIGELFTIRVAGNVMDRHQVASVEYAGEHLDCPLVLVLGHTRCGAVDAAIKGNSEGYIKYIADAIEEAIGDEKDDYKASCLNVMQGVEILKSAFSDHNLKDMVIKGAMYNIETGEVEIL